MLVGAGPAPPGAGGPAAWVIGTPLVALFGQPAALARQNAMRSPRRTAATAAALMIGIGLVGVIAIVAASMKASATASVQQTAPGRPGRRVDQLPPVRRWACLPWSPNDSATPRASP